MPKTPKRVKTPKTPKTTSRKTPQTGRSKSRKAAVGVLAGTPKIVIQKSTREHKKYMAKVGSKWVHFGDNRYQQYKDSTPLKLYRHLDHGDAARRANFKSRHESTRHKKYSPSWFADKYLW
jgi:hypothetical protein